MDRTGGGLVFTDINMLNMDGATLVKHPRARAAYQSPPLLSS